MRPFKQSTAVTLRIGPCLDSAGVEYTGLVIGDLTLTKAGTSAAMAAAATLTHVANGHYSLVTIAGNTDTLGSLRIDCNKSTYQIPPVEGEVLPATVYDALVTNATNTSGGLPAATGSISALAGAISTLTAAQAATGVWQDTTAGDFTVASSIGKSLYTSGAVPGTAGGLFIAGSNAATTISGLTTGAFSCTTFTASGAVAFQSTFGVTGTTTLAALNTGAIGTGNVTITGTLSTSGTATFNAFTVTNAMTVSGATTLTGAVTASNASNDVRGITVTTNNDKTGYGLSAAAVQAIWDAATSALTTVGSIGKWILDKLDVVLSTRLATSGYTAPLDAAGTRSAVGLASANLDTQLALRTGYKLASDGLDSISTTAPTGVAANFREMLVQLWRRFFKKSTLTSSQLMTYADNGSTVATTQAVTDDGTTQTQGAAT